MISNAQRILFGLILCGSVLAADASFSRMPHGFYVPDPGGVLCGPLIPLLKGISGEYLADGQSQGEGLVFRVNQAGKLEFANSNEPNTIVFELDGVWQDRPITLAGFRDKVSQHRSFLLDENRIVFQKRTLSSENNESFAQIVLRYTLLELEVNYLNWDSAPTLGHFTRPPDPPTVLYHNVPSP